MSASAFTAKVRANALGRTFKVQNNNSTVSTNPVYMGSSGCKNLRFRSIYYTGAECGSIQLLLSYDGGNPFQTGKNILDGGTPRTTGTTLSGGGP